VGVQLALFVAAAELVGRGRVVGRLRGDASKGETGVAVLGFEDLLVVIFFDAFGGGEDAVPVVGVPDFDVGVAQEPLLPVDFLEQLFGLGFGLLPVLVEFLLVFFQLRAGGGTRMMKLLMRRL
jgi:hypothetical protein